MQFLTLRVPSLQLKANIPTRSLHHRKVEEGVSDVVWLGEGHCREESSAKARCPFLYARYGTDTNAFFFFFVDQLEGAPVGLLAPHISVFSLEVALYFLCNIC